MELLEGYRRSLAVGYGLPPVAVERSNLGCSMIVLHQLPAPAPPAGLPVQFGLEAIDMVEEKAMSILGLGPGLGMGQRRR
jgi:hypothetical protein